MEFRLLGTPEVWLDGRRLELSPGKPMALLVAGLLRANRIVSTSSLVDAIWGDAPPATAAGLVQSYVSHLRRSLHTGGRQVIVTRPPGYLFDVAADAVDVARFEALTADGRAAAAGGRYGPAAEMLRSALAMWRGPALDGLTSPVLRQAADGLEELRLTVTEERVDAELRLGRLAALAAELATLVTAYPLRETLRAQQMLVLYRLGRQADALEAYRKARQVLREELGVEPGVELRRLHQAILTEDPSLAPPAVGDVTVAAPDEPAEDADRGAPARVPRQLPTQPGELIGRDREAAVLVAALRGAAAGDRAMCCAITGKAGSGKTALANAVAHAVSEAFPDGQLYAAFGGTGSGAGAGMAEAREVLGAFLRALGEPAAQLPESIEERAALFRSRTAGRRVLVVLDNAGSEAQIRPLLPAHAGSAVLLTSRTALLGLEAQWHLALDVLRPDDGLKLLSRLAGDDRVAAEPDAAEEIVRLCGGLPLAIRTVGARLALRQRWPLSVLAGRLRDEHRRLDELVAGDLEVRASLQLSYGSMADPVRLAFRRLGVVGPAQFSPWLLAPLLDVGADKAEYVADLLTDALLIDATGITGDGQPRYGIHELTRLFARERADAEEPVDEQRRALTRLAESLLSMVEEVRTRTPSDAQTWLDQERSLLVQTVVRASQLGLHRPACQLSAALLSSFRLRNSFDAWWRTHDAALTAAKAAGDRLSEAILLRGLGHLRYEQDRLDDAVAYYDGALSLFRAEGDPRGEADCLIGMAAAHRERGRFGPARDLLADAGQICARLDDSAGLAECAYGIGYIDREVGDFAGSLAALDRALAAYRTAGDPRGEGLTLRSMAITHRAAGALADAERLSVRAIAVLTDIGDELLLAYGRQSLAKVHMRQGRGELAAEPLRDALAVCTALDDRFGVALVNRTIGELHLASGDLDRAVEPLYAARACWAAMGLDLFRARAERDLAELHRRRGDHATAGELRAQALATFERYGSRERAELAAPRD
ncbi:AfsR/SARP family transcriptional regulator [Phytohabitans rumicis]|uniref:SARP family transcriptional regulator n=1 Tax=Phytohabitans rumicis TaxID=1076125 RepID=A0A6V8L8I2_9ACTN|nr:AfsR/SARP family transcriptional regulator [Phytohabitans rumicis]GFJ92594.1 SARP family transcriptional regulator [Phytohabitans rumicis]